MKIKFTPKYGQTEIDIPVAEGKSLYPLSGSGLTQLNHEKFTIINQIPKAPDVATKVKWHKTVLDNCDKRDGIFDKSSGTMIYKANTFTAYIFDWQDYAPPHWLEGGFYSMIDDDRASRFTVNVGDLIVFGDIPDKAPATTAEFTALTQKYRNVGGIIDGVNVYINHKPDGTPWKTNHIEVIKG